MSQQQCIGCLDDAIKAIPQCCVGKEGGRVIVNDKDKLPQQLSHSSTIIAIDKDIN